MLDAFTGWWDAPRMPMWWERAVVYQLYVLSFRDADGDGYGDLEGVLQRFDHLADTLGVDAVWLSPITPSPWADHGYDVADYTDVHPRLGTLDTLDRLLDHAHARGVRIILDWVPNHTSDRHPWFVASRSSRDSPYRDWYLWADPAPGGGPPNNWQSAVRGSVWEWDETTGQYYLHTYLPQQPDLNWRNPQVREAMFATLRFWLDRGVDGFRIDVAHRILKDPALRDNPPNPEGVNDYHKPMGADYLSQLHVHDQFSDDVHDVYRRLRRLLDDYGDRVAIGEIHLADVRDWASFYGGAARDEFHLPLNFRLMGIPWEPQALADAVTRVEQALPAGALPTLVLGNHDDRRLASRIGVRQARVAALLVLTLRGVPFIYQGDELGMTDVAVPAAQRRDAFGDTGGRLVRDVARTPMRWDAGPRAGFSPGWGAEPWLPVGGDGDAVSVAGQLRDADSLLNLYRRLLALRRRTPVLVDGAQRIIRARDGCLVYERVDGDHRLVVALNLTAERRTVELAGAGRVVAATTRGREGDDVGPRVALDEHEGVGVALGG